MERSSRLRITGREGLLCLSLTMLALIAALVIAASAQADEAAPGSTPASAESQEPASGSSSPESAGSESQSPAPGETTPPAETTQSEGTPAGAGTVPSVPVEGSPEESTTKVAPEESAGATPGTEETTSGVTPTESQGVAPGGTVEQTPVVTEEAVAAPPAEVTKELTQGNLAENPEEQAGKALGGERTEGAGEAGTSTPLHSSSLLETPAAQLDTGHAASASAEAPATAGAGLPVIAMIAGTEVEGPPPGGGPTAPAHAGMSPVQRAGDFSCVLSQLGGQLTDNCTAGWLGAPRFAAAAQTSSGLVTVAGSLVAATIAGTPSESGHGGVAISSPPVGPAPSSPAPGGAAGAATGGSGVAPLSTFLTLAGLLLLGAPRVLRRLRLSCEPWLAGCFVLVPERPD